MQSNLERDEGFTLVELLVVIVIIGVLAGVVVFAVGGITDRGQTSACEADAKAVEIAAETFRAQSTDDLYPADESAMVPGFLNETSELTVYTAGAGYDSFTVAPQSPACSPAAASARP